LGFDVAGTRGNAEQGWPSEELARARRPEHLHGFAGIYDGTGDRAGTRIPELNSASFVVRVVEEAPVQVKKPAQAVRPPADLAPAATGPEALQITQAILRLLVTYRTYAWSWDAAVARRMILGLGAAPLETAPDGESYRLSDGTIVRMVADGATVRSLELLLVEQRDPHLLDEPAFARLQTRFEQLFSTAVFAAKPLLGQPAFAGASARTVFPPIAGPNSQLSGRKPLSGSSWKSSTTIASCPCASAWSSLRGSRHDAWFSPKPTNGQH